MSLFWRFLNFLDCKSALNAFNAFAPVNTRRMRYNMHICAFEGGHCTGKTCFFSRFLIISQFLNVVESSFWYQNVGDFCAVS